MNKISRMIVEQHDLDGGIRKYKVVKLVNRSLPALGHVLSQAEIDGWLAVPGIVIDIVPPHKKSKLPL